MDDVKIKAFEKLIVDACNDIPISNRIKHYVLKDVAEKLLEASERDIAVTLALADMRKKERVAENEQNSNQDQLG